MRKIFDQKILQDFKHAYETLDALTFQDFMYIFAELHECVVVHLNQAWTEHNSARRTITDYQKDQFDTVTKPKMKDQEFVDWATKKYKNRNIIFVLSTFWEGIKQISII